MKKNICIVLLLGFIQVRNAYSQTQVIDSLKRLLQTEKQDSARSILFQWLSYEYSFAKPDSAMLLARQGLELAKKIDFDKGEIIGLGSIGNLYSEMGDDAKALEILLQALKKSEDSKEENSARVLAFISSVYDKQGDVKKSLEYSFKEMEAATAVHNEYHVMYSLIAIGDGYAKLNRLDSAMFFAQKGYGLIIGSGYRDLIGTALDNLGTIYSKKKEYSLALEKYRLSLPYMVQTNGESDISPTYLNMAKIFRYQDMEDSCLYYAKLSYTTAQKNELAVELLNASSFLADYYKQHQTVDSAYFYLSAVVAAKDSIFSQEKLRKIQTLSFNETIRQQEIAAQLKEADENHVRNLQLLAIGVFIPIFFLSVLFLSRTKVKPRIVEFLGVLSLLLFFEFITDLVYPYVSQLTNENPIWEMLFLVVLAALLEPLNFKLEHWVKAHLVHKPVPMPIPVIVENISNDTQSQDE
jgi:tetratricopeptide (TPR) repeat protein